MAHQKNTQTQFSFAGMSLATAPKSREKAHGGELNQGKRKGTRPFDPKQALHVVLRSSKASGKLSMLRPQHCNHIRDLVHRLKKRWNVSVYRYANVGNHLHLLIHVRSRENWKGFIRELSGGIAIIVTGAKKGTPLVRSQTSAEQAPSRGFWDHLVFTRIVSFGRDFKQVAQYVLTNLWEGVGVPIRKILAEGKLRLLEISENGTIIASQDLLKWFPKSG